MGSRGAGPEEESIRWPAQTCRTLTFHYPFLFVVVSNIFGLNIGGMYVCVGCSVLFRF